MSDVTKLAEACRKAAKEPMRQVAPNVWIKTGTHEPGEILGRFVEATPGEYRFVPVFEQLVRIDSKLLNLIGMTGRWNTLNRLMKAGFIEGVKIAPGTTLLNLASWHNHVARCAEDPELWEEGNGYREEYRKAL